MRTQVWVFTTVLAGLSCADLRVCRGQGQGVCNRGGNPRHRDCPVMVLGRVGSLLRRANGSLHIIRRGSRKPRLVYPGARFAREEASTPVAMSW
jgi:hypothetical protein